jgi:hypothetical protein
LINSRGIRTAADSLILLRFSPAFMRPRGTVVSHFWRLLAMWPIK